MIAKGTNYNIEKPAIQAIPTGTIGATVQSAFYDTLINTVTLSNTFNSYSVIPSSVIGLTWQPTIENLSPDKCQLDNGFVTRLSSGVGVLKLSYNHHVQYVALDFSDASANERKDTAGFVSGSYGQFAWDILKPMLDSSPSDSIFTTGDITEFKTASYNSACWASSFNFSGVTCWNSWNNRSEMPGTLITRRHLMMANHFTPAIGTQVSFKAKTGTVHTRTILGFATGWRGAFSGQSSSEVFIQDRCVAILDSDLPNEIQHYPVVGDWIHANQNPVNANKYVPAYVGIKLNRAREAKLAGECSIYEYEKQRASGSFLGQNFTDQNYQVLSHFASFNSFSFLNPYQARITTAIIGDSGSPFFLPLSGNTLALAGIVFTSDGRCSFPNKSILDAMIASADANAGVSTGYTVTEAPSPI